MTTANFCLKYSFCHLFSFLWLSFFLRVGFRRIDAYDMEIKEVQKKIEEGKVLPYLVSNVVEILEVDNDTSDTPEDLMDEPPKKIKCVVIKTSTRQTVFLPLSGLVEPEDLKPGDLIGVSNDSYLILEKLPAEYDNRVKAMEVEDKPQEEYTNIGGLDKQIEELREAVVLPITHKDKFEAIGIQRILD